MDRIRRIPGHVDPEMAPLAEAFRVITAEGLPAALVVQRGSRVLLDVASGTDPAHGFAIAFTTPRLSSLDQLAPLEAALGELG